MLGSYGISWDEQRGVWSISAGSVGRDEQVITGLGDWEVMNLAIMMVSSALSHGTTWPVEQPPSGFEPETERLALRALMFAIENTAAPVQEDQDALAEQLDLVGTTVEAIHGDLFEIVRRLAVLRDQIDDRP